MIAVRVRNDNHVQMRQVDVKGFDILAEQFDVVACVEKDALALEFNQCRVAPVLQELRSVTERIVQNSHPVLGDTWHGGHQAQCEKQREHKETRNTRHGS